MLCCSVSSRGATRSPPLEFSRVARCGLGAGHPNESPWRCVFLASCHNMCSRFSFFGTTELCGSYRQTLRELDVDPSSTLRLYRRTGGRPVNRSRTSTIPPLYRDSNTAKKKCYMLTILTFMLQDRKRIINWFWLDFFQKCIIINIFCLHLLHRSEFN